MPTSLVVESSIATNMFASPNNYGVTHIAIDALPTNVAWSEAVVVRKYSGYPQNINDGDSIKSIYNTNAILKVDSVSSGTVTAVTNLSAITSHASLYPLNASLNGSILAATPIGTSIGQDLKLAILSTTPSFTVSTTSTSLNYSVNDLVTVSFDELLGFGLTNEPNVYGSSGRYHLYDTLGTSTAVTSNPGLAVASTEAQNVAPTKVYYSLFIKYYNSYSDTQINTGRIWKKAAETSSFIVKNYGTAEVLANHLPKFYIKDSQTDSGNDLLDFLKVFAFQLDLYKAETFGVFYSTSITSADEVLLKLLLKEFGVKYVDVSDLSQARTLAANIVKIYKQSGSIVGLQTLIEAYTGYATNILYGTNILTDYNTSSFSENSGYWTPASTTGSRPSITSTGPYEVAGGSVIAAFSNGQSGYGRLDDQVTAASCSTSSTTVTGVFNSDLKPGVAVSVTAGTGVFRPGTVITSILSTNTFRVNFPPSTALATATIRVSTNLINGMGKVSWGSTATTASFVIGPKISSLSTTVSGTNVINIAPGVASVNDNVIHPLIPYGTFVTNVVNNALGTQTVTLSTNVTVTATGSTATFSQTAGEKIGSLSAWLPVQEGKPYSFSLFYNSGAAVAGTTTSTVSTEITFRDRQGSAVGSVATGAAYSSTVSTSNANVGVWRDVVAQGVAPATAIYAEPKLTIATVSSSASWFIDGVQFNGPIEVVEKAIPTSTTAKVTTSVEHKLYATRYGASGANYIYLTGLGAPYDGQQAIASIDTPTSVTFAISATSTAAATTASGLLVSNTPYEEARKTVIDVLPNRINLVTNPSFEASTNFWGTSANASSSAGVNCAIVSTATVSIYGNSSLRMTSNSTSPMSVYGHAGQIVSGVITNYLYPFKVESSTNLEDSFYTLSFYTKAGTVARLCYAEIYWYQDEAATIPSAITVKEIGTQVLNSTSAWTRHSVTGRVPNDAVYAKLLIYVVSSASSEIHYLDSVLLEKGFSLLPYFDGNFDGQNYTSDRDSMWETGGTADLCRSHFYLNRVSNTGKLDNVIVDGLYYA
jgi:phage tail-like protein